MCILGKPSPRRWCKIGPISGPHARHTFHTRSLGKVCEIADCFLGQTELVENPNTVSGGRTLPRVHRKTRIAKKAFAILAEPGRVCIISYALI